MDSIERIKSDLFGLSEEDFISKYFLSTKTWYFNNFLGYSNSESILRENELREHIKASFNLTNDDIFLVGSGKIGFSLRPDKLFRPFLIDDRFGKPSDIDIAIISDEIYHDFWRLFRSAYAPQHSYSYRFISREIYRGYINERNIKEIPDCRKKWTPLTRKLRKSLSNEFHFKHDVTYRIYRNKEDFFEYVFQNLVNLKRGVKQ